MKLPPAAVMVVVAATLISGCGSGDSSSSSEDSGTSAEQPARQYVGLVGREGEDANYALVPACRSLHGVPIYSPLRYRYRSGYQFLTCGVATTEECEAITTKFHGRISCFVEPHLEQMQQKAAGCAANEQLVSTAADPQHLPQTMSYVCRPL